MDDDGYDYERLMRRLVRRASRELMAEVLGDVAERGLPGEHHFYVSVDMAHPGVDTPDWLRSEHPEELVFVLQHEFWDLAVASDRFSVGLSFRDRPAELVVPFDAVRTFMDPSAKFGLQFAEMDDGGPSGEPERALDEPPAETARADGDVVSLDSFRNKR